MSSDIILQKREMRRQLRAVTKGIAPEQRRQWSQAACELMRAQTVWQQAQSVLFYAPLADELDLTQLVCDALAAGKTVALPRYLPENSTYAAWVIHDLGRDCAPGSFGISEPSADCREIPLNLLDLVIIPGVGFEIQGHRSGRGRGCYDRLLVDVVGIKSGVAFDQQIVERIPTEPHDARLDYILTPSRWIEIIQSTDTILK